MPHEQKGSTAEQVEREFEASRGQAEANLAGPVEKLSGDSGIAGESLTVRDVMTMDPVSMTSDALVVDAAKAMIAENVGSLPVTSNDALVGMVTDRDLVAHVLSKGLDGGKVLVAECCSDNPVTASPDEPLDTALHRMAQAQVRRLPVVEDGRLVGIVAQADVARAARPTETGELVHDISRG